MWGVSVWDVSVWDVSVGCEGEGEGMGLQSRAP